MSDLSRVAKAMAELGRMLKLQGRRLDAEYAVSRYVVVKATVGQCRHTRRNNLRVARIDARPPAIAARKEAARRAAAREAHEAAGTAT